MTYRNELLIHANPTDIYKHSSKDTPLTTELVIPMYQPDPKYFDGRKNHDPKRCLQSRSNFGWRRFYLLEGNRIDPDYQPTFELTLQALQNACPYQISKVDRKLRRNLGDWFRFRSGFLRCYGVKEIDWHNRVHWHFSLISSLNTDSIYNVFGDALEKCPIPLQFNGPRPIEKQTAWSRYLHKPKKRSESWGDYKKRVPLFRRKIPFQIATHFGGFFRDKKETLIRLGRSLVLKERS